jgi:hypothetical protein
MYTGFAGKSAANAFWEAGKSTANATAANKIRFMAPSPFIRNSRHQMILDHCQLIEVSCSKLLTLWEVHPFATRQCKAIVSSIKNKIEYKLGFRRLLWRPDVKLVNFKQNKLLPAEIHSDRS